jgi:hypothetical protein
MKHLVFIFLLVIVTATSSHAQDKHPCETNKCYAAFGFGFNDSFGFGSNGTVATPSGSFLVLETGDNILLESGDSFLTE